MLRFLSSLFNSPQESATGIDEALIDKGIERLLAGTDPRIRALPAYRKHLRDPVAGAIEHVIALVERLPEPAPIGPSHYGEDPRLKSFFVSAEHMSEVFGKLRMLRDFLKSVSGAPPDEIFGLLTMAREERQVLGMELDGDRVRKDVLQVAVNFTGHRYIGPAGSEPDSRRQLKIRAFDFLVERALERLMEARSSRRELDRQRRLLKQKLGALHAGDFGLGPMLEEANGEHPDAASLEAEIERIDAEYGQFRSDQLGLEESLECLLEVFGRPSDWLAARELRLRLDSRGIRVEECTSTTAHDLNLTELYSGSGVTRIILLGRIARCDIPQTPDMWKSAARYL